MSQQLAFFPANLSGPSILGELLSAGLGVQGMLWATSPACTELETHVLDWLVDMLALPPQFKSTASGGGVIQDTASSGGGVIQDTASSASLCALLAARERATGFVSNQRGCDGRLCREYDVWLHVDAAMSGTAALCPEFRQIHDGLELADSYCFNPHKWMFTNFDCDCFYVAERKALLDTLSILPEYLRNQATDSGAVIDYRDWQIPLGRRFRSLKLWFVIRHYGVEGLRYHVRRHVALAQDFAGWVRDDERFELAAPAPLNLVCFRHRGGDAVNQTLLERLNQSGELYLTHTRLGDQFTLRLCVGQTHTEARHVERAWRRIRELATELEVRSEDVRR